jgi:glucan biosynthesis protein C
MTHYSSSADPGGSERSRVHYVDAMRSHLMLLGVVLHAARPYDSHRWLVKDAHGGAGFDGMVWLVHLFRMPTFFVVAGYFAMLLLLRQPTRLFISERLLRTLVPMVATLLTLNLYQTWWLHRESIHSIESYVRVALMPDWQTGHVLGHLWFLLYLAIYNLLVALAAPVLRKLAASQRWQRALVDDRRVFWLLAAGVIAYPLAWPVVARGAPGLFDYELFGLIDLMELFGYLPFFAFGLLLHASPALFLRFVDRDASLFVLIAAGAVGLLLSSGGDDLPSRVIRIVAGSLLMWASVRVVFMLFKRWADRPSKTNRYLSDASYSIYLFHHLFVVVAASLLLSAALPAWIKFAIVLAVASLLSLAVHHYLIRSHAPMRYLFNGKLGPTHRETPGISTADSVRVPSLIDAPR